MRSRAGWTVTTPSGYYQPIGGSLEAQTDIAEEIADKIRDSGKVGGDVQLQARVGYTEDGTPVYASDFPE